MDYKTQVTRIGNRLGFVFEAMSQDGMYRIMKEKTAMIEVRWPIL